MQRPWVFLNVAMTADGKIAPANRRFVPFSSRRDHQLLMTLRTEADAVMSGARTVDLYPVHLGPGGPRYRALRLRKGRAEYNLRVVVSGSASLSPEAEIFKHRFSPILILTTEKAPLSRRRKLQSRGGEILVVGAEQIDWPLALAELRKKWNIRRLLCEGGGEVNAALFAAGAVDRLYLTICPLLFGGREAPTPADGEGVDRLDQAIRLQLESIRRLGGELFTIYRVLGRSPGRPRAPF